MYHFATRTWKELVGLEITTVGLFMKKNDERVKTSWAEQSHTRDFL
jgi:hypothetical protein